MSTVIEPKIAPEKAPEKSALKPIDPQQNNYHTTGDRMFDTVTYGGFALVGNELCSGRIGDKMIIPEKRPPTLTRAQQWYENGREGLHVLFGQATKNGDQWTIKPNKWITSGFKMFILTIGGNLMAIPVKLMEDVKKPLVKWIDRLDKSPTDPYNIAAHKELDLEPETTWGSVAKGRAVTLVSAIGMNYVIGDGDDAFSTKLFKEGSPMSKWASLDRINTQIVRWVEGIVHPNRAETIKQFASESPYKITDAESDFAKRGRTYGFIFIVSAALTALFYYSNKFFAAKNEKKTLQKAKAHESVQQSRHASTQPTHDVQNSHEPSPHSTVEQVTEAEQLVAKDTQHTRKP